MRNRNVSALLTLGAVAVFLLGIAPAAEAELICKKFKPSGPKVCWEGSTGSVNSTVIAQGVAAKLAKYCEGLPEDENCYIVIEFSIFGENPPDEYLDENEYCYTFTHAGTLPGGTVLFPEVGGGFDPPCSIDGQAVCFNPNNHFNRNGTAFNWPGPLSAVSDIVTCTGGGTCVSESTLGLFEDNGGVCNNLWTLDFTPYWFYGQVAFCPGGFEYESVPPAPFEVSGACCASDKRNRDGTCFREYQSGEPTESQPGLLWTTCDLPAECYDVDHNLTDACFDEDGLLEEGITFECEECTLPDGCYLDFGDEGYLDCFGADGLIGGGGDDVVLQCPVI